MYPQQSDQQPPNQPPAQPAYGPAPPPSVDAQGNPAHPPSTPTPQPQQWPQIQSNPAPQPADPWTLQQPAPYQEPHQTYAPAGVASIDYLDQISAPQKKSLGFGRKQLGILLGVLVLAVGVLAAFMISNSIGPSNLEKSQQLVARAGSLSTVVSESQPNIKTSTLSSLNSGLSIQMSGIHASLLKVFASHGITEKTMNKTIVAQEDNTELLAKLDDARLEGTFDRTYIREMSYRLEMLLLLSEEIQATTQDEAVKEQLKNIDENLSPLHSRLVEIGQTAS